MVDKSLLKIKKSGVSGKGVFSLVDIKNGESICFLEGEEMTLQEMSDRVDADEEGSSDPFQIDLETYLDLNELPRSINHSCEPNAFVQDKNELVALRDIKSGEEIFYDYSTTMADNQEKIEAANGMLWTCKCRCDSKNCRKIIKQFYELPKELINKRIKSKQVQDFILAQFK